MVLQPHVLELFLFQLVDDICQHIFNIEEDKKFKTKLILQYFFFLALKYVNSISKFAYFLHLDIFIIENIGNSQNVEIKIAQVHLVVLKPCHRHYF